MNIEAGPGQLFTTRARIADIDAVVALVNGAYRGESSRRGWTTEADFVGGGRIDAAALQEIIEAPEQAILVLRAESGILACAHVSRLDASVSKVGLLTVRPALQASGIGRRMLVAAESFAEEAFGARAMEMMVVEGRDELVAWYERRGYALTGETRSFPYNDERFGVPKQDGLRMVVLRRQLRP